MIYSKALSQDGLPDTIKTYINMRWWCLKIYHKDIVDYSIAKDNAIIANSSVSY